MTTTAPPPGAGEIGELRRALSGTEPGSTAEVAARLRLAERLAERFEDVDPAARDGADLDEIVYHAGWVLTVVAPLSDDWFTAQFGLLWAYEDRWALRSEPGDLDRAVEIAAELATVTGEAAVEITYARLLLERHDEVDGTPFPAVAEEALLRAVAADPTREQRAEANAYLGLARARRIRAGLGTTTTVFDLAEAIAPLQACLNHLPAGNPLRDQVLFELGVLHAMRYANPEFARRGGDADGELVEAIECLRDVRMQAPDVGYELVQVLVMRHNEHADPEDREDAIRLLDTLAEDMDVAGLGEERAELLGELYLARVTEDASPETLDVAVSFLERAVDSLPAGNSALEAMLLETYGRRRRATPAERARERRMLGRIVGVTSGGVSPTDVGSMAAVAAVYALESMEPASLDGAIERLRAELCAGGAGHEDLTARVALLGLLLVARDVGDLVPETLRPMSLVVAISDQLVAELLAWLERYLGRLPEAGDDDALHLLSVALLRGLAVGDVGDAAVAGQTTVRCSIVADLEVVAGRFAGLPGHEGLVLVAHLLLGAQHIALGRLTEAPAEAAAAAGLLNAALDGMGEDHPLRLETAVSFAAAMLLGNILGVRELPHDKAELVLRRFADDTGLPRDQRAAFRLVLGLLTVMGWGSESADVDLAGPVDECLRAVELLPAGYPDRDQYQLVTATLLADRYGVTGDLSDLEAARRQIDHVLASPGLLPVWRAEARDLWVRIEVLRDLTRPVSIRGGESLAEGIERHRDQLARLTPRPGAHRDGTALALCHAELARLLLLSAGSGEPAGAATAAMENAMEAATHAAAAQRHIPADSPLRGRVELLAGMVTGLLACVRRDRLRFLDAVHRVEAVEVVAAPNPIRVDEGLHRLGLATMWLSWSAASGDATSLDRALDHHRAAGADHGLGDWAATELHQSFVDAMWNRGRTDDVAYSIELGMRVLRMLLWRVLLQSGNDFRLQHAETAADWAAVVAMRCLVVGEFSRAMAAIEAGRGLVLRAGVATGALAGLLRREGRDELAGEWERAGGEDPPVHGGRAAATRQDPAPASGGVRQRVLRALRGTPSGDELTGTPPVTAVAGALRDLELDVLVYLVPGRDANFGRALLVHRDGALDQILLPGLRADGGGQVAHYVAARRAVDLAPGSVRARRVWEAELGSVGAWAWRHAVGPLRNRLRERDYGREPRVVLVPCGALGVVPWHVAREDTPAGPRHALRDLVFSYAGSARQLVELAARPRRDPAQRPVVVSDPTGDLVAAPFEARYLSGLYPSGRVFGLLDDEVPVAGRGSREEILAALPEASMVHFGCHAEGGRSPSTSLLKLADGQTLSVDRVLRRAQRGGAATGATVVLAACQSDLTEDSHDEALTLTNAFVAAGATSVIGTRWAVHDLASGALMCVFHSRLAEPGVRPLDALRAAQLWALDPDRRPPAGMAPELVRHLDAIDLREPALWAGFVHCGW